MVSGLLLPLGDLASCYPARPRPRPGEASAPHPGSRPDPAGVADRLRRRHLRDRPRLDLGSRLNRIRPPGLRSGPAALASTFVTSLAGVITFTILSINECPAAPNWPTGIALGISGILGGYLVA
jgi:hypothetical protein